MILASLRQQVDREEEGYNLRDGSGLVRVRSLLNQSVPNIPSLLLLCNADQSFEQSRRSCNPEDLAEKQGPKAIDERVAPRRVTQPHKHAENDAELEGSADAGKSQSNFVSDLHGGANCSA